MSQNLEVFDDEVFVFQFHRIFINLKNEIKRVESSQNAM